MPSAPATRPQAARNRYIGQIIQNVGAEANAYAALRSLLCRRECGIDLPDESVVVDTPIRGHGRPDFAIWRSGVAPAVRIASEHLFAVVEGKPGNEVRDGGRVIARDKHARYRTTHLRHMWLYDAGIVWRFDLSESQTTLPQPQEWSWDDLRSQDTFDVCFGPLLDDGTSIDRELDAFAAGDYVPVRREVTGDTRRAFLDAIEAAIKVVRQSVSSTVDTGLKPDLQKCLRALAPMKDAWGEPTYDWSSRDEPVRFPEADLRVRFSTYAQFSQAEADQFDDGYSAFMEALDGVFYALRADTDTLQAIARRVHGGGIDEPVSFLGTADKDKQAVGVFIQETASLLISRMLMIRFSEDHGLFGEKRISNSGLRAFAAYARHLNKPYQELVRDAYRQARDIYHHLFDPRPLDWIVQGSDDRVSRDLLQAMWIMAHWDFATVRGDILSGVYDRYLEPEQRRRLRPPGVAGDQVADQPVC